tara:strand:+ start:572 stop:1456 length:885 start_codon:yes stop_codon:yes gene_type:complete
MISGYGQDNLILERAKLPYSFPIIPYYEHGWSLSDELINSYKYSSSSFHLSWNTRMKEKFLKNKINKKVFITGSPFLFYKEKNDIKKKIERNSIFFVAHSTPLISSDTTIEKLDKLVRKLPDSIKPVDICCHYFDYDKFKNMKKLGYNVLTPGKVFDNNYPKKFYEIVSKYSHAISNQLGSYTLYCIDINIPFYLVDEAPKFTNFGGDKNVPYKYEIKDYKFAKEIIPLFTKLTDKPNFDQKKMVNSELGVNTRIDETELRKILIKSLKNTFTNLGDAISLVKAYVKPIYFYFK